MQVKTENGDSFWNLSGVSWENLICGRPDNTGDSFVNWDGSRWLCKCKEYSICEVVGYQIAQTLEIPVQPWVAFFQTNGKIKRESKSGVGILVQKWEEFHCEATLLAPAKSHSELVCRALALAVLDRMEWPNWLMNKEQDDLRLVDFEYIGPSLHWPLSKTRLSYYRNSTKDSLNYARDEAGQAGVFEEFERQIKNLTKLDFSHVVDFKGHPYGDAMKRIIVRGLEGRQREIVRLASAVKKYNLPP